MTLNLSLIQGLTFAPQLLNYDINHIDFAILTHDHADHIGGIDDLRPLHFLPKEDQFPFFVTPFIMKG